MAVFVSILLEVHKYIAARTREEFYSLAVWGQDRLSAVAHSGGTSRGNAVRVERFETARAFRRIFNLKLLPDRNERRSNFSVLGLVDGSKRQFFFLPIARFSCGCDAGDTDRDKTEYRRSDRRKKPPSASNWQKRWQFPR